MYICFNESGTTKKLTFRLLAKGFLFFICFNSTEPKWEIVFLW